MEVVISHDPRTLERMRLARPLHEALEDQEHVFRPVSPMEIDSYSDAFGSDLSDLTDSDVDDSEGEDDTDEEAEAMFTERGSEQEVEGQVEAIPDSSEDPPEIMQQDSSTSRHPRRSIPRAKYNYGDLADLGIAAAPDDDSDYVPRKSEGNRTPGPSSRPHAIHGRLGDTTSSQPGSSSGTSANRTVPKSMFVSILNSVSLW